MRSPAARALLTVLGMSIFGCPVAGFAKTRALIGGSNRGLEDEEALRYAERDADSVATTWNELALALPSDSTVLHGPRLSELRAALWELVASSTPEDRVLVFLSGHGDGLGLHLRGEVLPWDALRHAFDALRARRVVVFVDACRSGAILTAKGVLLATPLVLRLQPLGPRGRLLITSSGPDEASYESAELQASPFAHFLNSGLRGAADRDQDGRIYAAELYAYLREHTLAATL